MIYERNVGKLERFHRHPRYSPRLIGGQDRKNGPNSPTRVRYHPRHGSPRVQDHAAARSQPRRFLPVHPLADAALKGVKT